MISEIPFSKTTFHPKLPVFVFDFREKCIFSLQPCIDFTHFHIDPHQLKYPNVQVSKFVGIFYKNHCALAMLHHLKKYPNKPIFLNESLEKEVRHLFEQKKHISSFVSSVTSAELLCIFPIHISIFKEFNEKNHKNQFFFNEEYISVLYQKTTNYDSTNNKNNSNYICKYVNRSRYIIFIQHLHWDCFSPSFKNMLTSIGSSVYKHISGFFDDDETNSTENKHLFKKFYVFESPQDIHIPLDAYQPLIKKSHIALYAYRFCNEAEQKYIDKYKLHIHFPNKNEFVFQSHHKIYLLQRTLLCNHLENPYDSISFYNLPTTFFELQKAFDWEIGISSTQSQSNDFQVKQNHILQKILTQNKQICIRIGKLFV